MIDNAHSWLAAVPWESVVTLNQALCQAQKVPYQENARKIENVRARWQQAAPRAMTFLEVLELCRGCQEAMPFVFNNGNTFAAVIRTLTVETLKTLPPLEAQIVRTTICHYVAGQIERKELKQVLAHFSSALKSVVRVEAEAPTPTTPILPASAQPQTAA